MKGFQRSIEMAREKASARQPAFTAPDHLAVRFHRCHDFTYANVMSLACKTDSSASAASSVNEACTSEIVRDLHQMAARNILVTGHLSDRRALLAHVRKSDQEAQGQIGVTGQLHRLCILECDLFGPFDADQMHLHRRLLSGL